MMAVSITASVTLKTVFSSTRLTFRLHRARVRDDRQHPCKARALPPAGKKGSHLHDQHFADHQPFSLRRSRPRPPAELEKWEPGASLFLQPLVAGTADRDQVAEVVGFRYQSKQTERHDVMDIQLTSQFLLRSPADAAPVPIPTPCFGCLHAPVPAAPGGSSLQAHSLFPVSPPRLPASSPAEMEAEISVRVPPWNTESPATPSTLDPGKLLVTGPCTIEEGKAHL